MLNANAFTIRAAQKSDEPTLAWLAALSSRPTITRPALIGDIDGIPAAAISLIDGRVVADPFRPTSALRAELRLHRSGWRAQSGRDAARKRVRALIPFLV
jgi:hypothetical protein